MNISKAEQRVLHVLSQGGRIDHERENGRIVDVTCFTRDGYVLSDCTFDVFSKLKRRRLIESRSGGPYRVSKQGRLTVRAQPDNR